MSNGIGQTIADQIGRRAFAMMGASNLVAGDRSLTFKVGRNALKVSHVRVTLDPTDTYSVEFLDVNSRRAEMVREVSSVSGVYFDQLRGSIEAGTGLYLSL